jgi:hypothetical protein
MKCLSAFRHTRECALGAHLFVVSIGDGADRRDLSASSVKFHALPLLPERSDRGCPNSRSSSLETISDIEPSFRVDIPNVVPPATDAESFLVQLSLLQCKISA